MKQARETWPISSVLLILFGAGLLVMGAYFLVLRPPLLPEDFRYLGASQSQLEAAAPRLASWLTQVFRVLGGYVSATGILTIALAATSYRSHHCGAGIAAALAGLMSIGLMAGVNFAIDSDFKWELLALAILWASSMLTFLAEKCALVTGRRDIDQSAVPAPCSDPKIKSNTKKPFERHYADSATLAASAQDVFDRMDDFAQVSSHMTRSSAMMIGASMRTSLDSANGRAIGSHVRMDGRILGIELSLEEVVTDRVPRCTRLGRLSELRDFWSSAITGWASISHREAHSHPICVSSSNTTFRRPRRFVGLGISWARYTPSGAFSR